MAELHTEKTVDRINTLTQAIRKTCPEQNNSTVNSTINSTINSTVNSTVNLQQCQKLKSELLSTLDKLGLDSNSSRSVCLLFGLITSDDVNLHSNRK
jgi:hypothetical protein